MNKLSFCVLLGFGWATMLAGNSMAKDFDWRSDWELAEDLTMVIDSTGFNFPAHMAFVPGAGDAPEDPLYFVVELKGKVRVVTNDRTVSTFAEGFIPAKQRESFTPGGAAGICLDAENGYVFVTFHYLDSTQTYRNGMVRFKTKPGTFGLEAEDTELFLDLFADERSETSHQIGPCQVKDGHIYVSVGFGDDTSQAQNLHSTLGSILRMTPDFKPLADNPFYTDDGEVTAIDYIWAYGFRNPFGLKTVGDRLFATDNGGDIDRFDEVEKGENYMWSGNDWGTGARAAQIFSPAIGIVHLEYVPSDYEFLPEAYRGRFISPSAGGPGAVGQELEGARAVLLMDYNFEKKRMASIPERILRYNGSGMQLPVSVALGPDGMYFIPMLPNQAGQTPIYKIYLDEDSDFPNQIGKNMSPQYLIAEYGCRGCHKIEGAGGNFGPVLDDTLIPRLNGRLSSPEYAEQVAAVDLLTSEPFLGFRNTRQEILAASGEERIKKWLSAYLLAPSFDNPEVKMPNPGMTAAEADTIAAYLLASTIDESEEFGVVDQVKFFVASQIPELRYRHLLLAFFLGGLLAALGLIGLAFTLRKGPKT